MSPIVHTHTFKIFSDMVPFPPPGLPSMSMKRASVALVAALSSIVVALEILLTPITILRFHCRLKAHCVDIILGSVPVEHMAQRQSVINQQ